MRADLSRVMNLQDADRFGRQKFRPRCLVNGLLAGFITLGTADLITIMDVGSLNMISHWSFTRMPRRTLHKHMYIIAQRPSWARSARKVSPRILLSSTALLLDFFRQSMTCSR